MFGAGGRCSSSGRGGVRECQNPGGSSSSQLNHPMSLNMNVSTVLPLPLFQPQLPGPSPATSMGGVGVYDEDDLPKRDERSVPWGTKETKQFIAIRAELGGEFAATKRTKALWELVSERMKHSGFHRTPDQCKCKWKSLVLRYKGRETTDLEDVNQFPFYDDLHALFTAKRNFSQLPQVKFESGYAQLGKNGLVNGNGRPQEFLETDHGDDESDEDVVSEYRTAKKRKVVKGKKKKKPQTVPSGNSPGEPQTGSPLNSESTLCGIPGMLQEFFQQHQRIEMHWRESMGKFAKERELFENEWRQTMVRLERERIVMEQAWQEREEQRKAREESRAEKRDALLTALLKKLIQDKDS